MLKVEYSVWVALAFFQCTGAPSTEHVDNAQNPGIASQLADTFATYPRIRDVSATKIHFSSSDEAQGYFAAQSPSNYGIDPRNFDGPMSNYFVSESVKKGSDGDWNYNLGGTMNSAVAIWGASDTTGSCTDRLYAPLNATGVSNLYAFDNLYPAIPGGTGSCTHGGSDGGKCPSPYCPRRVWNVQLNGAMNRNSVALSLDGSHLYVATAAGRLYAINASDGSTAWTFNPGTDIDDLIVGATNITFEGATPWVDYATCPNSGAVGCTLYIGVWYKLLTSDRIRVYRIQDNGTSHVAMTNNDRVTIGTNAAPEGIQSSPVLWNGALYFGSTAAKLHKVQIGTTLTDVATSPWPIQLWSTNTAPPTNTTQPTILASVAIDSYNGLLVVPVNNMLWSVNVITNAVNNTTINFLNGNGNASGTNVACYSTPWLDVGTNNIFVGHGARVNGQARKVIRQTYTSAGALSASTTNMNDVLSSGSGDLTYGRSSPLFLTIAGTNYVFSGDGGGVLNRFTYDAINGLSGLSTFDTGSGQPIDGAVLVDYLSGFIYFGANDNKLYQISQTTLM